MTSNPKPLLEELPSTQGDVLGILAEMNALQTFFEVGQNKKPFEEAVGAATYAIYARKPGESIEDLLTTFCLICGLGHVDGQMIPSGWSTNPNGNKRSRENLALAWMKWVAWHDTLSVKEAIHLIDQEAQDRSIDTLATQFWAIAIEALAQGSQERSIAFFEKAMLVSSSFGLASNPLICWTYATSLLMVPPEAA